MRGLKLSLGIAEKIAFAESIGAMIILNGLSKTEERFCGLMSPHFSFEMG